MVALKIVHRVKVSLRIRLRVRVSMVTVGVEFVDLAVRHGNRPFAFAQCGFEFGDLFVLGDEPRPQHR